MIEVLRWTLTRSFHATVLVILPSAHAIEIAWAIVCMATQVGTPNEIVSWLNFALKAATIDAADATWWMSSENDEMNAPGTVNCVELNVPSVPMNLPVN